MKYLLSFLACSFLSLVVSSQTASSSAWTYIEVDSQKQKWGDWDEPTWLRYFGLDVTDVNSDQYLDIASGRYIYLNPGGDMTGSWQRITLPNNVDAILTIDVDSDSHADIIAQALPDIYWYEATDAKGEEWKGIKIGQIPATSHVNSQGFEKGQIKAGGREEFVIAGNGNIYLFSIPEDPKTSMWPKQLVAKNTSDEGIGLGDIDGDGDLDIAAGRRPEGGEEPLIVALFENEGSMSESWKSKEIGMSNHPIDRVEIADLDGDGKADIIISEERYPGLEPRCKSHFGISNPGAWTTNGAGSVLQLNLV